MDGWHGYENPPANTHEAKVVSGRPAYDLVHWVHRVFSYLKTWAKGVFHGLRKRHLHRDFVEQRARRPSFTARATPSESTRRSKLTRSAPQATRARFWAAPTCGATGLKGVSLQHLLDILYKMCKVSGTWGARGSATNGLLKIPLRQFRVFAV